MTTTTTTTTTTGATAAVVWMTVSYEAKAGERSGMRRGRQAAGGAPATATLLRPASPRPTLLSEQAGDRERGPGPGERESALTRFTTLMATARRRLWQLRECGDIDA